MAYKVSITHALKMTSSHEFNFRVEKNFSLLKFETPFKQEKLIFMSFPSTG